MTSKRGVVLAQLALGLALLIGATQPWVAVALEPGAAAVTGLSLSGMDGLPQLLPTVIALIALTLVMSIAGRIFRVLLSVLTAAASAWIAWLSLGVIRASELELVTFGKRIIDELTGFSIEQHPELIAQADRSWWPLVVFIIALLLGITAIVALVAGWRWRSGGRKYESRQPSRDSEMPNDRISDWDALSGGDDPSDKTGVRADDTPHGSPNNGDNR